MLQVNSAWPKTLSYYILVGRTVPDCSHDLWMVPSTLRFRRAHLNYNRVRMNYSDTNGICTHCDMGVYETTTHLLCVCPCYESARMDCIMALAALTPPQHLTTLTVLSGPLSCPPSLSRQINTITGIYIHALQRARLF